MEAKAVVFSETGKVQFTDVICDDPGANDIVVDVTHSWISNGTEGSYLRGERIAGDTPYRSGNPIPFPVVAGYQKVGVVRWVGEQVDDIEVGETVFAALGRVQGMFAPSGGHISPNVCDRSQVWKLPQGTDPLAFSGMVLTQVGFNCGSRADIKPGQAALVLGDGMVGQWAAQTLALRGVEVILIGRHNERLAHFAKYQNKPLAQVAVNAREGDFVEKVRQLAPDNIFAVVDTAGSIETLEQAASLLRRGGQIVSAGFYGTNDQLALQPLRAGEISVHLVAGWQQQRMDDTRDLIAEGKLQTLPLITHHFPVFDAAKAWQLIQTRSEPVLGVILDW